MTVDRHDEKQLINCNNTPYNKKIELIEPILKRFCIDRIFNRQDATDVAQNTLLILITSKNKYNKNKSFYAWAFTICRFQIKRYLTMQKRNREDSYDPDSFAYSMRLICNKCPFDEQFKKQMIEYQINTLHNIKEKEMTNRERDFFELSWAGRSREEIMKIMNLKKINYYQIKARVLRRLRKYAK